MEIVLFGEYSRAGRIDLAYIYPRLETKALAYRFEEEEFPRVLVFSDAAALKDYLATLPENTPENPYPVRFLDADLSSKVNSGNTLRTLGDALSRYVTLDLRECRGDLYPNITTSTMKNRVNIVSIILPASIHTIENGGFSGYAALVSVEAPGVETLGYGAFKELANLRSIEMPALVTIESAGSTSNGTFKNCVSLQSLSIPRIKYIGDHGFSNCGALTSLHFPELTHLGKSAFSGATSLETLEIPQVEFIGGSAFYGCTALDVLILGINPPELGSTSLFASGMPKAGIQVPSVGYDSYQNTNIANWSKTLKSKVISVD